MRWNSSPKNEDGSNPAQAEIEALRETLKEDTPEGKRSYTIQVTVTCGVIIFFYMLFIFFYLYRKMLAPFQKLEQYAGELAKGNLDVSLDYERTNFFGAFTWAFDHMREELIRSKKIVRNMRYRKIRRSLRHFRTILKHRSHQSVPMPRRLRRIWNPVMRRDSSMHR